MNIVIVNFPLTKYQKSFIDRHRNSGIRFYISDSLTGVCLTIRFVVPDNGMMRDGYLLTIDNDINANSKLYQVKRYLKESIDVGCMVKPEPDEDDFVVPF